jgi:thiamine pyrophosphokinase
MEHRTVVLAAGDFPRKGGAAWKLLAEATRVVACDSAADAYRRRFRKWPTVIIGDFDSFSRPGLSPLSSSLIPVSDQDTNDLEKALAYCVQQGWRDPVIVGATGKREDHALGNVFRALACGCEIVTDFGRFVPVRDRVTLTVAKGAAVSIFAPDPKTRMTSKGLEWPLAPVRFRNLYCATLNRATASRVVLMTNKPVSVFIEERKIK